MCLVRLDPAHTVREIRPPGTRSTMEVELMGRIKSAIAGRLPSSLKASALSFSGQPNRQHNNAPGFPQVPAGWQIAPPDFVGIGAQKSGTSWWYSLLSQHPDIATPKSADSRLPKELHFFDRFWDPEVSRSELAQYQRYFPRPTGGMSGEWTPRYLADPWVPALLAKAAPSAKLLVLLRDPIDRYHSGLTHSLAHGLPRHARTASEAFQRGFYGAQLSLYLEYFDRSQIMVQQYESCRQNPAEEFARTLRFLGLPVPAQLPSFGKVVNGAARTKVQLAPDVRDCLHRAYQADTELLLEKFPELDLSLWKSIQTSSVPG